MQPVKKKSAWIYDAFKNDAGQFGPPERKRLAFAWTVVGIALGTLTLSIAYWLVLLGSRACNTSYWKNKNITNVTVKSKPHDNKIRNNSDKSPDIFRKSVTSKKKRQNHIDLTLQNLMMYTCNK